MFRARCVCRNERQVNLRRSHAGKFNLCFFSRFFQALHGHLVAGKVNAVCFFEVVNHPVHHALVEVITAEVCVTGCSKDFLHAVAHLNNGNIECAAAQVVNNDFLFAALVNPIGKRCGRRLVDNALHVKAGNFACVFCCLSLAVAEVGRNSNNGRVYRLAEVRFCIGFQLLEYHGRNFLRGEGFVVYPYFIIRAHFSLDGRDGAIRVCYCLALCHLADHALAGL